MRNWINARKEANDSSIFWLYMSLEFHPLPWNWMEFKYWRNGKNLTILFGPFSLNIIDG